MIIPLQDAIKISCMKLTRIRLLSTVFLAPLVLNLGSCTKVNELEVRMDDTIKLNHASKLTLVRTGTGSGEWDIADKDGFNYYFTSFPPGNFEVELMKGKQNTYCHTTESNEVSEGNLRNEVKRDMLIKEKTKGEITIAIACHKPVYRFFSSDSIINVQMVVEDVDHHVRDTVVFKILRKNLAVLAKPMADHTANN